MTFEEYDERLRAGWYVDCSAFGGLRQFVDVQGEASDAKAAEEDDQVLSEERHNA